MKLSTLLIFAVIAFLGECAQLPKASKNDKAVKDTVKTISTAKKAEGNPTRTKQAPGVTKKKAEAAVEKLASRDTNRYTKHDADKVKQVKQALFNKSVKNSTAKTQTSAKVYNSKQIVQKIPVKNEKATAKKNKNRYVSPKSVIVPQRAVGKDVIVNSQFAGNPILDNLYRKRYEALEKLSEINNRIASLLNRKPTIEGSDHETVSSFLNTGSFDSGSYNVQGGTMFLGPANAGNVIGMENASIRDGSSSEGQKAVSKDAIDVPDSSSALMNMPQPMNDQQSYAGNRSDRSQTDTTAPVDMPQPMDDQLTSADNESAIGNSQNPTAPFNADLDAMNDQLVLGDPEMFDSVCSVLKLTFEHTQGAMVLDDSSQSNNAELENGAYVSNEQSKSGLSVNLGEDGYMSVPDDFKGKPTTAAAISMWAKLKNIEGKNPLFQAYDSTTMHYDLEVVDGKASWIHRDDFGKELFNVTASDDSKFTPGKWHHVVGTYSAKEKEATLWLDGRKIGSKTNVTGLLSQNWDKLSLFEGKTAGVADNVFMFRCPLDRTKVVALYVAAASPKDAKKSQIPQPKKTH